ncbi:Uncharacterized protein SCF082_LOCUS5477, partial [Durusdinium trenchii]
YTAPGEIFRCFRVRQALHRCVEESTGFLEVYERLVQKVLVPWLKQQAELSERTRFSYQFPPTLRLQPGNSEELLGFQSSRGEAVGGPVLLCGLD